MTKKKKAPTVQQETLNSIAAQIDAVIADIELQLRKERQNVVNSGFHPRYNEAEFWHIYRDIYDAYVEDIEKLVEARSLIRAYKSKQKKKYAIKYGIDV